MRRIVPDTQAVLRGRTNSKPSPDTSVTNSEGVGGDMVRSGGSNGVEVKDGREAKGKEEIRVWWSVLQLLISCR